MGFRLPVTIGRVQNGSEISRHLPIPCVFWALAVCLVICLHPCYESLKIKPMHRESFRKLTRNTWSKLRGGMTEMDQMVLQHYLVKEHVHEIDFKGNWIQHAYNNYTWMQKADPDDRETYVLIFVPLHYSIRRRDIDVNLGIHSIHVTCFNQTTGQNITLLKGDLCHPIIKEDGASYWEIAYENYKRVIRVTLKKAESFSWDYCFPKYPEHVNGSNINVMDQIRLKKQFEAEMKQKKR
ncbi:hypothetical protein AAMO2058_001521900 [Amorphochlora amoebiformis]